MPDLVVSNTSPLFYLYQINQLDVLERVYGEVIVPAGVNEELEQGFQNGINVPNVYDCPFLTIEKVERPQVLPLISDLDRGERETLLLVLEQGGDLVLIDDKMARKIAKQIGIRHIGTLGVLLRAKREGAISKVDPLMEELISHGFYIDNETRERVLMISDEA